MVRKHLKKIVILSLFFLLVCGFVFKPAVGLGKRGVPVEICMTVAGDIVSTAQVCWTNYVTTRTNAVYVRHITLSMEYFQEFIGRGCFPKEYTTYNFNVRKERDGTAHSWFWLDASNADGEPVHYRLDMYGTLAGDIPPPDRGITQVLLNEWVLSTEGGGKAKKTACRGEGTFSVGILITRTNL